MVRKTTIAGIVTFLMLTVASLDTIIAQGTVIGTVEDANTGERLTGVNMIVDELTIGTTSDASGQYRIENVPAGSYTLVARYLGYQTQRVTISVTNNQETVVQIRLQESLIELDQVIVTGAAGTVQRRAIGNTITSVKASDIVEYTPVPTMQALINGRAPGVVIMPGTGMVGGGSKIRIRGSSSINLNNDPIIFVDGIRVDNAQATGPAVQGFGSTVINRLNDFNPDDIENIEILKGASAATLYGTDASNGVIIITTKKGSLGRPQFSFTNRFGYNYLANIEDRMYENFWRFSDGRIESLNLVTLERERGKPIFEPGSLQGYNFNVSGGNQGIRYYISTDYDLENGVEPTNQMNRLSTRANISIFPIEGLDVTANVGYIMGRTDLACEAGCGGVTWGSFFSTPNHNQPGDIRRGYRSFVQESYYEYEDWQDLKRFTSSVQANYVPVSWWTHRITVGLDVVAEDNRRLLENSPVLQLQSPTSLGYLSIDRRDVTSSTFDYSGTLQFTPMSGLTSRTSYGMQYYNKKTAFVGAYGNDFALPGLRSIQAAARTSSYETYIQTATLGFFVEEQLGYNDRMFLSLGLRADDNSAFGDNYNVVIYPKASFTWVISEEDFFNVPYVSSLRLRSAYGATGQSPGPFDSYQSYVPVTGVNRTAALTPGNLGNPDLGPETTTELDLGFEGSFLDERLSVEFSYYNSKTTDAILFRQVAPSTGFAGERPVNIAEVKNYGVEILVNAIPVRTNKWRWDITTSFATNESELMSIDGDEESITLSNDFGAFHRIGYPLGSFFHHKLVSAELDANGATILSSLMCATPSGGSAPCYNGTTFVGERVYIGPSTPKFEGAFSTTVMFRNQIRLGATIDYKLGHYKYDNTRRVRGAFSIARELAYPLEYDPIDVVGYRTNYLFSGSGHISDASFARLREVSLSYIFPSSVVNRLGVNGASFTLAGRNLMTWTKYTGLDPETMFLGGARGGFVQLDQNALPQLTQVVGTFNIKF